MAASYNSFLNDGKSPGCWALHLARICILERPVNVIAGVCRKSATATAEGLYKQARKRRRAGDKVVPLLESAQETLKYLE